MWGVFGGMGERREVRGGKGMYGKVRYGKAGSVRRCEMFGGIRAEEFGKCGKRRKRWGTRYNKRKKRRGKPKRMEDGDGM